MGKSEALPTISLLSLPSYGSQVQGIAFRLPYLANKTKTTVALKPANDNVLQGEGKFALDPNMKVVVSVTLPEDKEPQQARFEPLIKQQK